MIIHSAQHTQRDVHIPYGIQHGLSLLADLTLPESQTCAPQLTDQTKVTNK